jgi:O-antigen/teichoic acid export membrane protein
MAEPGPAAPADRPADPPDGASGARRMAGNAAWLLSGQLVSKLASVVFVVIVARAVGVVEYGYFTFATALVPLFLAFGTLGIDTAVIRELSRDRRELSEVFSSGLYLRLVTGGLALVLSIACAPLFADARLAVLTVLVVGVALFIDEMTSYVGTVFKAFERMRYYAMALVVNRIGSTALALVAFLADAGLVVITVTYFLGSLGALLYAVTALRRHFPPIRFSAARRATAVRVLRIGAPLGVAAILNMALFRLDTVMVQAITDSEQVGLYGVAFRFFESLLFLTWVVANLTFPRISRQGPGRRSAQTLEGAVTATMTAYLPVFVGSLFLSAWAVAAVFGDRYVEAAEAVPYLTFALVCYGLTYQVRTATMAVGGGKVIAWIAGVALAVNVPANLLLIPQYGFTGAAMATAGVSALESLLTIFAARRYGLLRLPGRLGLPPVLALLCMTAVLLLLPGDGAVTAAVATAVYLVALLGSAAVVAPAEVRSARQLLRRRGAEDPGRS